MGMDRFRRRWGRRRRRDPHARADGPRASAWWPSWSRRSPCAWGWTAGGGDAADSEIPTRVGMDRVAIAPHRVHVRSPRAWGSTESRRHRGSRTQRSPRAWGWTALDHEPSLGLVEIPRRVGMDRCGHEDLHLARRDPHARGDGPCTRRPPPPRLGIPTRVGMDRRSAA